MNDRATGAHRVTGHVRAVGDLGVVRLEARFGSDVDDVWSALTDPSRLGLWLGHLEGELRRGGEVRAGFVATGWEGTLHVDACDPGERLSLTTNSPDEPECVIDISVTAEGRQTTAVFEDRGLPWDQIAAYGAGDQVLVEDLAAHLAGRGRCDARSRWQELLPDYQALAQQQARPPSHGT